MSSLFVNTLIDTSASSWPVLAVSQEKELQMHAHFLFTTPLTKAKVAPAEHERVCTLRP
jgi:hypothetical protein